MKSSVIRRSKCAPCGHVGGIRSSKAAETVEKEPECCVPSNDLLLYSTPRVRFICDSLLRTLAKLSARGVPPCIAWKRQIEDCQ